MLPNNIHWLVAVQLFRLAMFAKRCHRPIRLTPHILPGLWDIDAMLALLANLSPMQAQVRATGFHVMPWLQSLAHSLLRTDIVLFLAHSADIR